MRALVVVFFLCSCQATKLISTCGNFVEYQYEEDKVKVQKDGRIIHHNYNSITIFFMNSFNDEVICRFGDEILMNEHITSDERTGSTGRYITKKLKIEDMDKDFEIVINPSTCAKIPIKNNYHLVYVFIYQSEVIIRYSNTLHESI